MKAILSLNFDEVRFGQSVKHPVTNWDLFRYDVCEKHKKITGFCPKNCSNLITELFKYRHLLINRFNENYVLKSNYM